MKIANIYPIKSQEGYKRESIVMILAHLVKEGLYNLENFDANKQYIIMDNGLYEKAQVSTNLQTCIDIAKESKIPVNEIIIPDVVNDLKETKRLFEENLNIIKANPNYNYMFVAQAKTYEELEEAIRFANANKQHISTIGISKLTQLDRGSKEAIKCYLQSELPIHFLGIKTTFKELLPVYQLIRSCDTSQLAYIAKHEDDFTNIDTLAYTRQPNKRDIDLAKDSIPEYALFQLYLEEQERLIKYGIL